MALFHQIPGAVAVLQSKGVFKQADLYQYGGFVFAKHGGGFVRIKATGGTPKVDNLGTSIPTLLVVELELPYPIKFGDFGNVKHKD